MDWTVYGSFSRRSLRHVTTREAQVELTALTMALVRLSVPLLLWAWCIILLPHLSWVQPLLSCRCTCAVCAVMSSVVCHVNFFSVSSGGAPSSHWEQRSCSRRWQAERDQRLWLFSESTAGRGKHKRQLNRDWSNRTNSTNEGTGCSWREGGGSTGEGGDAEKQKEHAGRNTGNWAGLTKPVQRESVEGKRRLGRSTGTQEDRRVTEQREKTKKKKTSCRRMKHK